MKLTKQQIKDNWKEVGKATLIVLGMIACIAAVIFGVGVSIKQ